MPKIPIIMDCDPGHDDAIALLWALSEPEKLDLKAVTIVAGNQTFGVRQTADILEKFTWGLVSFIIVVSVISSFTLGSRDAGIDITDQIENVTTSDQPAFPTAPIQQEAPTTEDSGENQ